MNDATDRDLGSYLLGQACTPVDPPIAAIGEAARQRHGGVAAVLFYGSCLRDTDTKQGSDQEDDDNIADLYLLVDTYRAAYDRWLPAFFNWVLPPNVSYIEAEHEGRTVRAKYAVMTLEHFERGAARWLHPYVWARFAQPCRLAYQRDEAIAERVGAALASAVRTLAREVGPLIPDPSGSAALWVGAFRRTYRVELRAEEPGRAQQLYEADRNHYDTATAYLRAENMLATAGARARAAAQLKWAVRRPWGKILSVARLAKAAFTFRDGVTYILWKIERHSGVSVTPTPWQRRHPILASTTLFWRLYAMGAFK